MTMTVMMMMMMMVVVVLMMINVSIFYIIKGDMFVCLCVCIYVPYGRPNGWANRDQT